MKGYKFILESLKKLTKYDRFVLYKGKIPYSAYGGLRADVTNPSVWCSFEKALKELIENPEKYDGIGYVLEDGTVCIDIDHCIDENGNINDVAKDILSHIVNPTYTEISQSGTGLHIICEGVKNTDKCRSAALEIYSEKRYIALTGNPYGDELHDISENQELIDYTMKTYLFPQNEVVNQTINPLPSPKADNKKELSDEFILERAQSSENAIKFVALWDGDDLDYPSSSEADLALMNMLAFWTGRNAEQMERLFNQSLRVRDKTKREDYMKRTINQAILNCKEVYNPDYFFGTPDSKDTLATDVNPLTISGRLKALFPPDDIENQLQVLFPLDGIKFIVMDELTLSKVYSTLTEDKFLYVLDASKWVYYDGIKYSWDSKSSTMVKCGIQHISEVFTTYLDKHRRPLTKDISSTDKDFNDALFKLKTKISSISYRLNLVKDLQGAHVVRNSDFDTNRNLFNCKNGTFNIATGKLQPHNPKDLITKVSGVNYDPSAQCPLFEATLSEILSGDEELTKYLCMVLGSALLGINKCEKFYFLYGKLSRNGKSTITQIIQETFGDYGGSCDPETFASCKRDSRGPSPDIARLHGKRFIQVPEPNKSMILDCALLKRVTGNDTMVGRRLNEDNFEFTPMFVVFFNTNYLPKVVDNTLFMSDRVRVIPFNRHFEEKDRNLELKDLLKAEVDGVFNWLLKGMNMFLEDPLYYPNVIKEATIAYQATSDKLQQFIDDTYKANDEGRIAGKYLYEEYQHWCNSSGYKAESKENVFEELKKKGYMKATATLNHKTVKNVLTGFIKIATDLEDEQEMSR